MHQGQLIFVGFWVKKVQESSQLRRLPDIFYTYDQEWNSRTVACIYNDQEKREQEMAIPSSPVYLINSKPPVPDYPKAPCPWFL